MDLPCTPFRAPNANLGLSRLGEVRCLIIRNHTQAGGRADKTPSAVWIPSRIGVTEKRYFHNAYMYEPPCEDVLSRCLTPGSYETRANMFHKGGWGPKHSLDATPSAQPIANQSDARV
ncbi:predicted protein [Uncinocarpus reesii 1704]|uniref:Uncharacterized protein n=1 Tax=Uncinocarpus reesii (strain UAMH 1704) TaxID=336963 RepID=C4JQZ3_UNCRE|nr:uncharacterized protein UREG_03475 [Uncinocarpus reesii 1704]EEP78629.1 predicted protein [Uncinocarpus reesii 1704]